MPCMFLHYSEGTFTGDALDRLSEKITHAGVELENLALTDYVLSTTLIFCREYPKDKVYHGGKPGGENFVTLDINVLQGGFSAWTKTQLLKQVTDAIGEFGNLPKDEPRRVYVLIREVPESNWGFDGQPIALEVLRDPPKDAKPL